MVLTKYFSLSELSPSCSKAMFHFKCGCLGGSNYLTLHCKLTFSKIHSIHNFQTHCGPSGDTKTSRFF